MFRFFRLTHKGLFFFKRIRIGIRLVMGSLQSVIFNHHKYFIFCFLITILRFIRIKLTYIIDPTISFNFLFTEFLVGQNMFNIIIDYGQPLTKSSIVLLLGKISLLYIELFVTFFIILAVVYYSQKENALLFDSLIKSLKKYKLIFLWSFLEITLLFLFALFGLLGEFLQFVWQLMTSLAFQVIAFEYGATFFGIIYYVFHYFKRMFANIIGIDLFVDIFLIVLTAIFYYLYQTQIIQNLNFYSKDYPINFVTIVSLLYVFSVLFVSEVVTFTRLYILFRKHPKQLE